MEFNYDEEIICDHKVTTIIKKVWAKEIELLGVLDDICKKHDIKYYIFYGSLLGAIRHKGFIPWDDDIDVVMTRPDYNKFLKVAAEEIKDPYYFQTAYNDLMIWAFSKIRDSRTSAIEFPDMPEQFNQGIFIDIFPLDSVRDGSPHMEGIYKVERDIWRCIFNREGISKFLDKPEVLANQFVIDIDTIREFVNMSKRDALLQLELFAEAHYNDSDVLGTFSVEMIDKVEHFKKEWLEEIVYVPFCNIEAPAPKSYDEVLRATYGNYMEIVKGGTLHESIIFDPDMPYKEWLRKKHDNK